MTLLNAPPATAFVARFDPFAFFEGRTLGDAEVRLPHGGLLRRAVVETAGKRSADFESLQFDEAYAYDDGSPPDIMHWAVTPSAEGGVEASELSVLTPVRSRLKGCEWRLSFGRRATPPNQGPLLRYRVRFTQVSEGVVLKMAKLSLMGVPMATLRGFHRKL